MRIFMERKSTTAITPTYGSSKAAGLDLYADIKHGNDSDTAPCTITIHPHETIKVGTGWGFEPPENYCGLIFARSGLASKSGVAPANKVGLCDKDYTGEYIVALHNHSKESVVINHGDRIAQLMFVPYEQARLIEVDHLTETTRGDGGFGSTGK